MKLKKRDDGRIIFNTDTKSYRFWAIPNHMRNTKCKRARWTHERKSENETTTPTHEVNRREKQKSNFSKLLFLFSSSPSVYMSNDSSAIRMTNDKLKSFNKHFIFYLATRRFFISPILRCVCDFFYAFHIECMLYVRRWRRGLDFRTPFSLCLNRFIVNWHSHYAPLCSKKEDTFCFL